MQYTGPASFFKEIFAIVTCITFIVMLYHLVQKLNESAKEYDDHHDLYI